VSMELEALRCGKSRLRHQRTRLVSDRWKEWLRSLAISPIGKSAPAPARAPGDIFGREAILRERGTEEDTPGAKHPFGGPHASESGVGSNAGPISV